MIIMNSTNKSVWYRSSIVMNIYNSQQQQLNSNTWRKRIEYWDMLLYYVLCNWEHYWPHDSPNVRIKTSIAPKRVYIIHTVHIKSYSHICINTPVIIARQNIRVVTWYYYIFFTHSKWYNTYTNHRIQYIIQFII